MSDVLLTGGTGFIGKRLIALLSSTLDNIYILVRKQSVSNAERLFADNPKVKIVVGDLTNPQVVDDFRELEQLHDVDSVIHLAATYDLAVDKVLAYKNNVVGTQHIIALISRLKSVKHFHYVSTFAVNKQNEKNYSEETLDDVASSQDHYSWSKNRAEHMVRNSTLDGVKTRIYRPGIVVGDARVAKVEKADGPYMIIDLLLRYKTLLKLIGFIRYIPLTYNPTGRLPLVSVDHLCDWLAHMVCNPVAEKQIRTYHLFDDSLTTGDFLKFTCGRLGIKQRFVRLNMQSAYSYILGKLKLPPVCVDYLNLDATYEINNTFSDFPTLEKYSFSENGENFINGALDYFRGAV